MRTRCSVFLALGLLQPALCQRAGQLAAAIASYPDLSSFKSLLDSSSKLFDVILSGNSSEKITILIPTNAAFATYADNNQHSPVTSLPDGNLTVLMQYHMINAAVTSKTVKAPRGITAPTLLKDTQYNNRSGGAQLAADYGAGAAQGQVLFISPDPINPVQLRMRQATSVSLRGGLAQTGVMQVLDGQWPGGYFQSIDTVLTPPMTCVETISSQPKTLSSLDDSLDATGLWPTLNTAPNVTCLAPSNNAFKEAGNPDTRLNKTDLTSALLFHTLTQPIYTNYITDGMVIKSVGGPDVKISLIGNDIYFNDAKVISPNVITNNGLIHVLDKVMSPNGTAPAASSGTATATATSQTGSSTASTKSTSTSTSTTASASASSGAGGSVGMMAPAGAIGKLAVLAAGAALVL